MCRFDECVASALKIATVTDDAVFPNVASLRQAIGCRAVDDGAPAIDPKMPSAVSTVLAVLVLAIGVDARAIGHRRKLVDAGLSMVYRSLLDGGRRVMTAIDDAATDYRHRFVLSEPATDPAPALAGADERVTDRLATVYALVCEFPACDCGASTSTPISLTYVAALAPHLHLHRPHLRCRTA